MIIKKFQVGLYSPLLGLCAIALVNIATPQARAEQPILDNLVQQAASKDQATSQQAIAKLRKYKNAGVEALHLKKLVNLFCLCVYLATLLMN